MTTRWGGTGLVFGRGEKIRFGFWRDGDGDWFLEGWGKIGGKKNRWNASASEGICRSNHHDDARSPLIVEKHGKDRFSNSDGDFLVLLGLIFCSDEFLTANYCFSRILD